MELALGEAPAPRMAGPLLRPRSGGPPVTCGVASAVTWSGAIQAQYAGRDAWLKLRTTPSAKDQP